MPKGTKPKEIYTTFEAAEVCNVSYNTIKNWIKRGLIDAYRTAGGHMRIKFCDLEVFCREHCIPLDKRVGPELKKILIVDDEEAICVLLQNTLKKFPDKLNVSSASDGFEAGILIQSLKPDIVILDLVMPGIDGFKVCQNIRNSPVLKHAKIVVLSGYASESNFARAIELGADVCLAKPVDSAKLIDTIKSLLMPRGGVRRRRAE